MCILALECITKPIAKMFHLCRDVTSEEVCFVDIAVVSFCLEELFVKLVSPCCANFSCSSFRAMDLRSYGGFVEVCNV